MAFMQFIQQGLQMYTQNIDAATNAADQAGQQYANAEIEDSNADALTKRAGQASAEGVRNEEQLRRGYRDFAGKQLTSIAESGLAGDGSAIDVVRDSETRANLDALKVRYQADTQREGLMTDARAAKFRSAIARALAQKNEAKRDQILELYDKVHKGSPVNQLGNKALFGYEGADASRGG